MYFNPLCDRKFDGFIVIYDIIIKNLIVINISYNTAMNKCCEKVHSSWSNYFYYWAIKWLKFRFIEQEDVVRIAGLYCIESYNKFVCRRLIYEIFFILNSPSKRLALIMNRENEKGYNKYDFDLHEDFKMIL